MNQTFTAILQKLVAEQGKEVLLTPAKCKSFLADYTRGEYAKERRLLLQAQEAGALKAIDSAADINLCKQQQVKILREEYSMAEEAAKDLVDTLALILRRDTSKTEAPDSLDAPSAQVQNTPLNMIKKRSLLKVVLLSIITYGIYAFYWWHTLAKDINTMCEGDGKKTGGLFMIFTLGDRLRDNAQKYNITIKEGSSVILLWSLPGLLILVGPFVALHIIIKNTNAMAEEYNKRPDLQKVKIRSYLWENKWTL